MGEARYWGEFTVRSTKSKGFDAKAAHLKDVQLSASDMETHGLRDGDLVAIRAAHEDLTLSLYGRVEERSADREPFGEPEALSPGEAGIGIRGREALAVQPGDDVEIGSPGFERIGLARAVVNDVLKIRPVACRARKAVSTDAGHKVCLLPDDVRRIVGIEWGDRVVLQSADDRLRGVKALPISDDQRAHVERRERVDPESYPPPFDETGYGNQTETSAVPRIYVNATARRGLGIADGDFDGVYQPVKVHRDSRDLFVRLLDDLTVPFLLGGVALVVGLDVGIAPKLLVIAGALGVVLYSAAFQARRVLLE